MDELYPGDPNYPALLGAIPSPPTLYVRGAVTVDDALALAIVGARDATPYGVEVAERLAGELGARGVTIVSGLARGIDAASHRGALDAGGRTLAVLRRVHDIDAAPENGERASARVERAPVRHRVDAAREAAHDRHAARPELAGQSLGDFDAVRRGVARADDRERERIVHGDRAAHVERRRRRDRAEQRGIVRVSWIELVHGSARRSGGSVYRTGPPGQRLQADTVARGASAGPRRPCEGVTRPSSPAPSPGSPAPRAATSGAPGSDRAGSGDTGRS